MREDDVFRVEIADWVIVRVPEFFIRDEEMNEETEMSLELPDIFMLIRLSSPSVSREKTEEVNEVSMETVKLLRESVFP